MMQDHRQQQADQESVRHPFRHGKNMMGRPGSAQRLRMILTDPFDVIRRERGQRHPHHLFPAGRAQKNPLVFLPRYRRPVRNCVLGRSSFPAPDPQTRGRPTPRPVRPSQATHANANPWPASIPHLLFTHHPPVMGGGKRNRKKSDGRISPSSDGRAHAGWHVQSGRGLRCISSGNGRRPASHVKEHRGGCSEVELQCGGKVGSAGGGYGVGVYLHERPVRR